MVTNTRTSETKRIAVAEEAGTLGIAGFRFLVILVWPFPLICLSSIALSFAHLPEIQKLAHAMAPEIELYRDAVAFWCLTSSSLTTCFTWGTCSTSFSTEAR